MRTISWARHQGWPNRVPDIWKTQFGGPFSALEQLAGHDHALDLVGAFDVGVTREVIEDPAQALQAAVIGRTPRQRRFANAPDGKAS